MKRIALILAILLGTLFTGLAQNGTERGLITSVKPHFANTLSLEVNKSELILVRDKTGKSFEINHKYKDLVLEKDGTYILNPKYAGKSFSLHYVVNGKGWKCIQSVKASGK
ncbi:MAG: hypothetical protein ACHQRM_10835 [Bacteroidia bacterium]